MLGRRALVPSATGRERARASHITYHCRISFSVTAFTGRRVSPCDTYANSVPGWGWRLFRRNGNSVVMLLWARCTWNEQGQHGNRLVLGVMWTESKNKWEWARVFVMNLFCIQARNTNRAARISSNWVQRCGEFKGISTWIICVDF